MSKSFSLKSVNINVICIRYNSIWQQFEKNTIKVDCRYFKNYELNNRLTSIFISLPLFRPFGRPSFSRAKKKAKGPAFQQLSPAGSSKSLIPVNTPLLTAFHG